MMRGAAVWAVVLAACIPSPPAALPDVDIVSKPRVDVPERRLAPLPEVGSDVVLAGASVFPWPLDQAPSLLPHDADAVRCDVVARGPDLDAYAAAWCEEDREARLSRLERVARLAHGRLAVAALADEIDLLADRYTGMQARVWLAAHDAAPSSYDRVAATYVMLDRRDDALAVATSAQSDSTATPETRCRRALRIEQLGGPRLDIALAAACRDDVEVARCAASLEPDADETVGAGCGGYLLHHPDEARAIELAIAARERPRGIGTWYEWLAAEDHAVLAMPEPHAEAFAAAALANAMVTRSCRAQPTRSISGRAHALLESPAHDPALTSMLTEILTRLDGPCPN